MAIEERQSLSKSRYVDGNAVARFERRLGMAIDVARSLNEPRAITNMTRNLSATRGFTDGVVAKYG